MDRKSSWLVGLVLVGAAAPFLLDRSTDCYQEKAECEKDWSAGDCAPNPQPANQCHYYGRSHYTYFRGYSSGATGGNHSTQSFSRGGFGSTGHGFFHGGS